MFVQPVLNERTLDLADITFSLEHHAAATRPDDEDLTGSHIHDHYEVYINVTGDVSFLVNNRLYPVRRGNAIVTRPGDVHVCVINSPCIHEHFCLWISAKSRAKLFDYVLREDFCGLLSFERGKGEALLQQLFQMQRSIGENNELAITAQLLQVLLLLSRSQMAAVPERKLIPDEMQSIINYLDANFLQIRSVSELSSQFGISPATLNRWFRRYIQVSPLELVKAKRIAYAKKLLDSGATVTESCMQSGFSDCSYFISTFKKKFGETPLKYKQHSQNTGTNE